MQPQSMLLAFLKEMFLRLKVKSPKFFRILQMLSAGVLLITGTPQVLAWFNVHISMVAGVSVNTALAWASAGALFIASLTTQSKPAALSETGEVLKKTDAEKLPFTATTEAKAALKEPQIPIVTELK